MGLQGCNVLHGPASPTIGRRLACLAGVDVGEVQRIDLGLKCLGNAGEGIEPTALRRGPIGLGSSEAPDLGERLRVIGLGNDFSDLHGGPLDDQKSEAVFLL